MPLELKSVSIACPRCQGRRPMYVMLEDGSIVYCYPPVAEGTPGLVNAVSVGCAIVAVTSQEQLDPDKVQHFILLAGLDERFVEPSPCPDAVLTLCHEWLGEKPTQVTASGGDWELPPPST